MSSGADVQPHNDFCRLALACKRRAVWRVSANTNKVQQTRGTPFPWC